MAMAAKSFGRRPREEPTVPTPAASLGAVLELMRALNWFIRADVSWPTKRGQAFDFVLAGESGVFALWVHEGEPVGVEEAAAQLGGLLGVQVRPVVCRAAASLAQADSSVLFCTPETALDLLVGLPAYAEPAAIPGIVNRLRDLVVPLPPEPKPEPVPEPVVIVPSKVEAPKVETPRVEAPAPKVEPKPQPVAKAAPAVKPAPVVKAAPATPPVARAAQPAPVPEPVPVVAKPTVVAKPAAKPAPVEPSLPRVEPSLLRVEPSVVVPAPAETSKQERVAGGRHRSEKPKRTGRKTPPAPPRTEEPESSLALPTAIAPAQTRRKGSNDAAQRFDNNYVYVPKPVERPSALKREFRAKPFFFGIVGLLAVALVVGVGIKEWPKIANLAGSHSNPSTTFGQSLALNASNFHPNLALTVSQPEPASVSRGAVSYAVTLTAVNSGPGAWQLPSKSAFTMTDSLGESVPLAAINGPRWSGSLAIHHRWVGKLIFKIRAGRTPASVQFALASAGGETATWH